MTRNARMIDVFLSSPSDVGAEREFVERAAHEWNVLRGKATGCHINILTWEDAVAPAVSDRPQSIINDAIGGEYDVFLGVMWGRFGTPTGAAESGTVEEFNRALDRYRQGENLRLAMLFKTAPIPTAQLSGEQFDKVQAFKKRFADEGGLYREFEDEEMLRKVLNRLFEEIATSHSGPGAPSKEAPPDKAPASIRADAEPETSVTSDQFKDIGLFELNDNIAEVSSALVQFLEKMSSVNEETTATVGGANGEMQTLVNLGQATPTSLRKPLASIIQALNKNSSFLEANIPEFREKNDELIELTDIAFDIASDFSGRGEGEDELRVAVEQLLNTLLVNRDNLDALLDTIRGLPRMSTEFNKAKRRQFDIQSELRAEIDRLVTRLASTMKKHAGGKLAIA